MACTESQLRAARTYRTRHLEKSRASGRDSERRRRERGIRSADAWEAREPERVVNSNHEMKCRNHGITPERYATMFVAQDGLCAICGNDEPREDRVLSIDHDHSCCPGKLSCGKCVRGLLCSLCNPALGAFRDNKDYLTSAIEYLDRTSERQ